MALPGWLLTLLAEEDHVSSTVEAWAGGRSGCLVLLSVGLQEVCPQPLPSLHMLCPFEVLRSLPSSPVWH